MAVVSFGGHRPKKQTGLAKCPAVPDEEPAAATSSQTLHRIVALDSHGQPTRLSAIGPPMFLDPLVQAVRRQSEPFGDLFNRVALLRHLPNCFPLELVRISMLSHINTPDSCLILGFQKCLRKSGQSTWASCRYTYRSGVLWWIRSR